MSSYSTYGSPGMNGLDALSEIKEASSQSKVIILPNPRNENEVLRAISLGAAGYLLKSSTATQIKEGIHTVMTGALPSILRRKIPDDDPSV